MRFEIKVIIMSLIFSIVCMFVFTYGTSLNQKTIYVCQVGIYKEEENKNNKLNELKDDGIEGYSYIKDNKYYVLSMISENKKEVEEQATKEKGIMKSYVVSNTTTKDSLLEYLSKGETTND